MGHYTRKVDRDEQRREVEALVSDLYLSEHFPAVLEYLTDVDGGSGRVRATSTLLFVVDQGRLKGCLNDRDNKRTAWVSGESMEAILTRLEAGLKEDDLEWRYETKGSGWKRKD